MPEVEIRWPSAEYAEVPIGTHVDLEEATGLSEAEARALVADVPDQSALFARSSSQGKGASGPAFAVVLEIERIATDGATLIVLGSTLRKLIEAVAKKVHNHAVVEDPNTLGAIALAATQDCDPLADVDLKELRYISTVPITAYPGVGTDASDIWAACFRAKSGDAVVVFITPHGTWLGRVRVPAEYYFDEAHQPAKEQLKKFWHGGRDVNYPIDLGTHWHHADADVDANGG